MKTLSLYGESKIQKSLNIGGARFETSRSTLRRDSNSLLAKLFTTIFHHSKGLQCVSRL